mgnify:FL=1
MKSYSRYLSVYLALQLAISPLYGVAADLSVDAGAPVSQRPTLDRAGNNVPVVQITRPSGAGVSMNRYGAFNIGAEGLILNNANQITQTQLGGFIEGNPNLHGHAGAGLIVNQVGGQLPSSLQGYAEVAGRQADVVIANPNGITCNGCGFINIPRATLATGQAELRSDGSLGEIKVRQGLLRIDGEGLNASNTDRVDLLARAIEVNANLYATDLNAITGTNAIDYDTLETTAIAGEGSAPQVALDVSGIGGMYANRIFMVGTEKGLGVNSEGVLASLEGDLTLSADGSLRINKARSAGSMQLASASADISLNGPTHSDESLYVDAAGTIAFRSAAGAADTTNVQGDAVTISGTGQLYAGYDATGMHTGGGSLSIAGRDVSNLGQMAADDLSIAGRALHNTGDIYQTGNGRSDIELTGTFNNEGRVSTEGELRVAADALRNAGNINISQGRAADIELMGELANEGVLSATGDLHIESEFLNNTGEIHKSNDGSTDIALSGDLRNDGLVSVQGELRIAGNALHNTGDMLQSGKGGTDIALVTGFTNRGQVVADGTGVTIAAAVINNEAGATVGSASDGALALEATDSLRNRGQITGKGDVDVSAVSVDNQQGAIIAGQALVIETETLNNQSGTAASLHALSVTASDLRNAAGSIKSNDSLTIATQAFTYEGDIDSALIELASAGPVVVNTLDDWRTSGDLLISTPGSVTLNGKLQTGGDLEVSANGLSVGYQGLAASQGDGVFDLTGTLENRNRLSAGEALVVSAGNVVNYNDLGGRRATLTASQIENRGLLFGLDDLTLRADSIDNQMGGLWGFTTETADIFTFGDLVMAGRADGEDASLIRNHNGLIRAEGDIEIQTDRLENLGDWTPAGRRTERDPVIYSHGASCFSDPRGCVDKYVRVLKTTMVRDVPHVEDHTQASIVAGGQLSGHATNLTNRYSYIGAGSSISLEGTNFNNLAATDEVNVTTTRESRYWKKISKGPFGTNHKNVIRTDAPVTTKTTETVTLASATIESGGSVSLNFSNQFSNGELTDNVSAVSQTSISDSPDTSVHAGTGVAVAANTPVIATVVDPVAQNNFHLPDGSGLFNINNDPQHPYLVETNPLLTDYANFTSSDYLLDRLGWDGADYLRRIGDGFYELTLVEQSLQARTGSRLIDGQGGMAMFQQLMDNAVIARDDLNLSPGVALTKDQVNRLTRSMIWMETRQVDGQELLVPVVYLSANRELAYENGALIAGRDVSITGDSDVVNVGVINALDALTISSKRGGLTNREGRLQAGQQIDINVAQDIVNQSGEITGGNVRLTAGGNIQNETLVKNLGSLDDFAVSQKGQDASIVASHDLAVSAAGDVHDRAGQLHAGDNIAISAGGDIRFDSQKQVTGFTVGNHQNNQSLSRTDHLTSSVISKGDLLLSAGDGITLQGTEIAAANDARLQATGDINVLAVADTRQSELHYREKGEGLGSDKTVDSTSASIPHKQASITAGSDLSVSSGENLQIYASTLQGGDRVGLIAGSDIQLVGAVDQQQQSYRETKESSVRRKDEARGYHHETATKSLVSSDGDLQINSGGNVQITGSDLAAGDHLQIGGSSVEQVGDTYKTTSGENVSNLTVDALALNNEEWAEKSRSFTGVVNVIAKVATYTIAGVMGMGADTPAIELGSRESDRVQQVSQQSSALAAHDIAVNVDDSARFMGASVSSAGTFTVNADNIQIDAVANTTSETHVSEKETIKGLGAKLERDEFRVGGIEERKDQSTQTHVTTQWQGSQISAGNIELNASNNIQVVASDVASNGDIDLQAGNSIQVGGRQDTQTTTDSRHTEIRTTSAGVKNAYVDAAYALQAMNDARKAVSDAKKALSDAEDKVAQGKVREQDLKYYRANLAAATANLAQAGIAFVAAGATAAVSTGTGGFYATGSTERSTFDSSRTEQSASWNGSQILAGGNASLSSGEDIEIVGSDVAVNGNLSIDSKNVNIVAGIDTSATTSSNRESNQSLTASYGAQGLSGSGSAGYRNADSDSSSLTHRNSTISAGSLESTSETLTVAGADVAANTIDIDTDTLDVRSLQNQSSSESKTRGGNAGLGVSNGAVSSVSAGIEMADGSSGRTWTDNQTRIIGRDSVTVNAKDTTLAGAVIANATTDANGQLVDQGNLSMTTDTLTVTDLNDTDRSENRGINLGVTVNLSGEPRNDEQLSGPQTGQTTVGGHYYGHDRAQTTHATIGQGQIVVAGKEQDTVEGLNRDLESSQKLTRDQAIGGLNASVTVDHRLLSSEGRDSIVNDAIATLEHGEDIVRSGQKVADDKDLTVPNFGEVLHNNAQGTQLKNDLLRNPENAHILAGLKSENPEEYAQAVSDLGHLAQEKFGLSLSDINLYDAGSTESASLADSMLGNVKGGVVIDPSSPLFGKIFVDAGDGASKTDMTFTLGHEVLETQSLQGKGGGIFGSNSEQSQEALGDAFGEQLASRINQAAGGNLDATGGRYFSARLKQSQPVLSGTVVANQVGSATVDNRQLYVQEARAILDNAPAYAERYGISETQAKKELIQQALLMVDKDWAEQTHVTENDQARQALESIAAAQSDKARDILSRTLFNQIIHKNESGYFQADEAAYNDSTLNAGEASLIEAGLAGEDNLISRYGTEHGQKPLEVAFSDSAARMGANARQSAMALYDEVTRDPLGLAVDTANGIYEGAVTCVTTSKCIAPDQTHGTARDRQLVAELQGNADAAVAEAADSLGATLGDLTAAPGVGKAAKSGVAGLADTAADQARKNAKDWVADVRLAEVENSEGIPQGLVVDSEIVEPNAARGITSIGVGSEIPNSGLASAEVSKNSYAELDSDYVSRADLVSNASTFKTQGLDTETAAKYLDTAVGQNMLDALWAADPAADASTVYSRAMDQLSTGADIPTAQIMDAPLVKIVPEDNSVSPYSPFFTTQEELMKASSSSGTLADYFGLPLNSESPKYSIFEISPKQPAGIFRSTVAPTTELDGLIDRTGGGTQYLVPNRSLWSEPSLIGTIDN